MGTEGIEKALSAKNIDTQQILQAFRRLVEERIDLERTGDGV